MNITLTNPCGMQDEQMTKAHDGHYCPSCKKNVTDYSHMTDREMIAYIQKHGLGCGTWRPDQLNRKVIAPRKKAFPLPWAASLLLFITPAKAQQKTVQDTILVDTVRYNTHEFDVITTNTCNGKKDTAQWRVRGTGSFIVTQAEYNRMQRKIKRQQNSYMPIWKRFLNLFK